MKTVSLINCLTTILMAAALPAGSTFAQEKKLPEDMSVLTPGMDGHRRNGGPNGEGEFKIIEVDGQPFKQAIRATVKKTPSDVWHTQISTLLAQPVKRGDVVLISFHVRSEKAGGAFNVYFGTPETDLEVTFAEELSAGEKWKHVQIPATVAADYEAGKGMLNFDFGLQPQTLEFADIKLVNFGAKAKVNELPRSGY